MLRLSKITWKKTATYQDRVDCMSLILGVNPPPIPSEYFINDTWVDERTPKAGE